VRAADELTALHTHPHEAILRQDHVLNPPGLETDPLPAELYAGTPLIGRRAELDALREAGATRPARPAGSPSRSSRPTAGRCWRSPTPAAR
jgi:hypothetical protein